MKADFDEFKHHKEELRQKNAKLINDCCKNELKFDLYLATADNVKFQGDIHYHNNDFDQAYAFYQRFGLLFTTVIAKHPSFHLPQHKSTNNKLKKVN